MFEPCRKQEQRTVFHLNYDLIGVVGSKLRDWRTYDASLRPRVVEIHCVRICLRLHVVGAAEKVVRMAVRPVSLPRSKDIHPAACDCDGFVSNLQKIHELNRSRVDASNEFGKGLAILKIMF